MKSRRFVSLSLIAFLAVASLWGQTKPRIAVLPLSSINVSGSDAQAITSLFETALVKTGVFNVIEQNQIKAILDAQRFSLQGCTDESCAVEVGKLLAAEQIVIGELSRVGNRFILNAKIIDVQQGKNIRADNVSASSLEEIADTGAAMLAAKLAGLTYQQGSTDRIATSFGELFIATEPSGAEVYVNGISRGISPCLVERVPVGQVVVTARKDNLYNETPVELKAPELMELTLRLEIALGRIFVKSMDRSVSVHLDGKELGLLGSGLFKDLPAGEHSIELKGNGVYWNGSVTIESGKTVTVEAFPSPFGTVRYRIPEGASAVFTGSVGKRTVSGEGEMTLAVGVYTIRFAGDWYEPREERIEIVRGGFVTLAPELPLTEARKAELASQVRQEKTASILARMDEIQARLDSAGAPTVPGPVGSGKDASAGGGLDASAAPAIGSPVPVSSVGWKEGAEDGSALILDSRGVLADARAGFPELEPRAAGLLSRSLSYRIIVLTEARKTAERKARQNRTKTIGGLIIGAAGFVVGGYMSHLVELNYEAYQEAATSADAVYAREQAEQWLTFEVVGFALGGVGSILGLGGLGAKAGSGDYTRELASLQAELAEIGGQR